MTCSKAANVNMLLCRPADSWRRKLHLPSGFGPLHYFDAASHRLPGYAIYLSQRTRVRLWIPVLLWAPDVLHAWYSLSARSVQSGQKPAGSHALQLRLFSASQSLCLSGAEPAAPEELGRKWFLNFENIFTMSSLFFTCPDHGTHPAQLQSWINIYHTSYCLSAPVTV